MNNSSALIRAIRGPLLLIVLGALFALDYFGDVPFRRTWPALLIVYGVLILLERVVPAKPGGYGPNTTARGSL